MRGQLNELQGFLILIAVGIAILSATTFFSQGLFDNYDAGTYYNVTEATQMDTAYGKLNTSIGNIQENLAESSGAGAESYILLFSGGFEAVKQIPNILDAIIDMIGGIGTFLDTEVGLGIGWFFWVLLGAFAIWTTILFLRVATGR